MKHRKVYYYDNELEDEFSGIKRNTITVDENYRYSHGRLWKVAAWVLYHIIMTPAAFIYMKLRFCMRIEGKDKLCGLRDGGDGRCRSAFFYGNHTQVPGDGYIPACISFPRKAIILAHPDNVSLYGTKNIMEMLGAFPIPNKLGGMKNFLGELENYISMGYPVFIYPEAHIWPYYTRIRPFNESSFRYPVIYDRPAFSFTITYQKHLFRTKITIYIDGPFYPDTTINPRQAAVKLRNQVHDAMTARSENSTYDFNSSVFRLISIHQIMHQFYRCRHILFNGGCQLRCLHRFSHGKKHRFNNCIHLLYTHDCALSSPANIVSSNSVLLTVITISSSRLSCSTVIFPIFISSSTARKVTIT